MGRGVLVRRMLGWRALSCSWRIIGTGSSSATNSFGRRTYDSFDEIMCATNIEVEYSFLRLHTSFT